MVDLLVVIRTPHGVTVPDARVELTHADTILAGITAGEGLRVQLPFVGRWGLRVHDCAALGAIELVGLSSGLVLTSDGVLAPAPVDPLDAVAWVELTRADRGWVLLVTLEYRWFTPQALSPTSGNKVEVLIDGEAAWSAVADAIDAAQTTVHLTTWIYQGAMELRRPEPTTDPDRRRRHTIQDTLQRTAERAVDVRLLVWDAPFIGMASELECAAQTSDDHFEVLKEANPTSRPLLPDSTFEFYNEIVGGLPIGSYHQKTACIDGVVGFCGGMNLKENDWDAPAHDWFDPRRCEFKRDRLHRMAVQNGEEAPDHIPRHDLTARIEGPAVADLESNFRQRWNDLIDQDAAYAAQASHLFDPAAPRAIEGRSGVAAVQVVRTMPDPVNERSVLDVYLRAVRAAKRLIYIENQYFRSTWVTDAVVESLRANPSLELIVLTKRSEANGVLSGGWSHECVSRIRAVRPSFTLYGLFVPRADEDDVLHLEEVDLHAKLMIVDDHFYTVGSCNLNDRGFEFEGEINVAVVDPNEAWRLRFALFREHLADDPGVTGEIDSDVALFRAHAARNATWQSGSVRPYSRVFPFETETHVKLFDRDVF